MPLRVALAEVLTRPTPAGLWALRAEMLEARIAPDDSAWPIVARYHEFLDQMASCLSSRHYSDLASKLDIGSITGVVLERLMEPQGARELALSLLSGALSEGLMVMATRQHVKAWEQGMAGFVRSAAWFLYEELWRWSEEMKRTSPPPRGAACSTSSSRPSATTRAAATPRPSFSERSSSFSWSATWPAGRGKNREPLGADQRCQ